MKIRLSILLLCCTFLSNAWTQTASNESLEYNQEEVEERAELRLKEFLKVEEGTRGWFNTFVRGLYEEGRTKARRGQVSNYLWSTDNLVAFHFFTYGGGANTHFITCVNKEGKVVAFEHMLTQSLSLDNYYNVDRYMNDFILATEETPEMHLNNGGKSRAERTYVSAKIYGVNSNGEIMQELLK